MSDQDIARALRRMESVLLRRPSAGLNDDAGATARWTGGTRVVARHADGHEMATDISPEMGGGGGAVSPGWMLRAGVASCSATCIAMTAAMEGVALTSLEVEVTSRSDLRGLLGVAEADGSDVDPGPQDMVMTVRVSAPGVPAAQLRALVEKAQARAAMTAAVQDARAVAVEIEVVDA